MSVSTINEIKNEDEGVPVFLDLAKRESIRIERETNGINEWNSPIFFLNAIRFGYEAIQNRISSVLARTTTVCCEIVVARKLFWKSLDLNRKTKQPHPSEKYLDM